MKWLISFITIILLITPFSSAAIVQGEIYDFSLDYVTNIIIEVNSSPIQKQVVKNGSYSFELPNGDYELFVFSLNGSILGHENLIIINDGNYQLDIILFPEFDTNEEDVDLESDFQEDLNENNYSWIWAILIIVLLLIIFLIFNFRKNRVVKSNNFENDELVNKVLEFIKNEKRIKQKDLRKLFPYSEAKISLIISELESKGKIEKIKKGRGNIIIFKKESN